MKRLRKVAEYPWMAWFDESTGQLEEVKHRKGVDPDWYICDGVYDRMGEETVIFYRADTERLVLRVRGREFVMGPDLRVEKQPTADPRLATLVVWHQGCPAVALEYDPAAHVRPVLFGWDDPENVDLGLFLVNVSRSPEKQALVFRGKG